MIIFTRNALAYIERHWSRKPNVVMDIRYRRGCACCYLEERPYVRVRTVGATKNHLGEFTDVPTSRNFSVLVQRRIFESVDLANETIIIDVCKIRTGNAFREKLISNIDLRELSNVKD
jgi:hypothetical protein